MTLQALDEFSGELVRSLRLIASDMDGTLTQSGQFSTALLAALDRLNQAHLPLLIVTGRSAGWVQGIAQYLPVLGAIAENGGLFFRGPDYAAELLVEIPDLGEHRDRLAQTFQQLQRHFPQIQESSDNRFRLTDWTFDVQGLSQGELGAIAHQCHTEGWGFTYSTVQCHIRPLEQDKSIGLLHLLKTFLQKDFPALQPHQVLTLGDSPNDASLFNPKDFPLSVGVANVRHYRDQLPYLPRFVTGAEEAVGFCELVDHLLRVSPPVPPQECENIQRAKGLNPNLAR